MSQDSLEDFLAVASELRVGGIGLGSREDKAKEDLNNTKEELNSRRKVWGVGVGQESGTTILQSDSNWDPNMEERQKLDYQDSLENTII